MAGRQARVALKDEESPRRGSKRAKPGTPSAPPPRRRRVVSLAEHQRAPARLDCLTAAQRTSLSDLAATVPIASTPDFCAWLDAAYARVGMSKVTTRADLPAVVATPSARAKRFVQFVLDAAAGYLGNRQAKSDDKIAEQRRLLTGLIRGVDGILGDDRVRLRLYHAAERHEPGSLEEFGCTIEKTRAENHAFAYFGEIATAELDLYLKIHMRDANRPGPWARDAARDLREAARYALSRPPFTDRRKRDDTQEQCIRSLTEAWERVTGRRARVAYSDGVPSGGFFDFVSAFVAIVEPSWGAIPCTTLATQIRRAQGRKSRGMYFSK